MGGNRWLQETPRKECSFFVTHRQTLHHNIYIIIIINIINTININIDIDIDKVENASATIRKLGLTLPVLPIQVSHLPLFT